MDSVLKIISKPKILFILVLILAALLRFWNLGTVPNGMTWDEAAIGYNGFALWQDRRDEWLQLFPISFRSFGDYKAPLAIYLNGFFTGLGGVTVQMVRLPFALASLFAISGIGVLIQLLVKELNLSNAVLPPIIKPYLGTLAALWLTLSPWHFHYSRAGFESGISLSFTVWFLYSMIKMFKSKTNSTKASWGVLATLFAVAGIYSYHSAKIVIPLLLVFIVWVWRRHLKPLQIGVAASSILITLFLEASGAMFWAEQLLTQLISTGLGLVRVTPSLPAQDLAGYVGVLLLVVTGIFIIWMRFKISRQHSYSFVSVLGLVLLLPLLRDSINGSGSERLAQAAFWHQGMSVWEGVATVLSNLLTQLSPQFLVMGQTTTLRHGSGAWGVLLPTSFLLFTFGLFFIVWSTLKKHSDSKGAFRLGVFGLVWVIIGILPAVIGSELPHSNRGLLALPGFFLVMVTGAVAALDRLKKSSWNHLLVGSHGEKNMVVKAALGSFVLAHLIFFTAFIRFYYVEFARYVGDDFKSGYLEMFQYVEQFEKASNGFPNKDQIIVSSRYGQPYIYALFVRKTRPIFFHSGSLSKYLFVDEVTIGDLSRTNAVIVATKDDTVPLEEANHYIYGPAGEVRFAVYVR